jgi:EAL domain-containing protein (putative c-di-GMP-specific phosphodiesterase class I)/GGDEF domain-containing protein
MPYLTEHALDRIIDEKKLSVYFQPIVENNNGIILGYEALIRGPLNSPFHSPLTLFKEAGKQDRLVELELLCWELSILQFKKLHLSGKLFLNISPETLFQPNFRPGRTLALLQKIGLDPRRMVIELTEHTPLENYEAVRNALKHYKEMGFEIAMDDLGSGYSGLRMWYELRPDYVKIDRHFMSNIDSDKVKQQFVKSIKDIVRELNCQVIAEGIETAEEFQFINKMGLPFSQGYYIARPSLLPVRRIKAGLFTQERVTMKSEISSISSRKVGELLQNVAAISVSTTVQSCATLFNKNPELESIPVVDGKKAIGLLRRNSLTNLYFSLFGRELSGKNSISSLVDRHVLFLENDLPIDQASGLISEQVDRHKALEFIITQKGCYQGIGSVIDLLKIITNLQINNARYANPLTLLPGNVPISKKLDKQLAEKLPFIVCYIDIDNFKPYNDCYGYDKGDQIITGLANILREVVTDKDDFIGHIGGDDFILTLSVVNWKIQCDKILETFSEWVRHRYRPEDQIMGGVSGIDRAGNKQFFPLLSLSIGCICLPPPFCKSYRDIAVLATYAKSMAQKQRGNSLFIYDSKQTENHFREQAG